MSTVTLDKTLMNYNRTTCNDVRTGAKTLRPRLCSNGTVTSKVLSGSISADYGLRAGKPSHVLENITMTFEGITEWLRKGYRVNIESFGTFSLSARGPVDPDTGKPTAETKIRVIFTPQEYMTFDTDSFELSDNAGSEGNPWISSVRATQLKAESGRIVRDVDTRLSGSNLYFDAAQGDKLTISYVDEGEAQSISITPDEVDSSSVRFKFPVALKEVPAGTALTVTLETHMGEGADAAIRRCSRKAVLVES